MVRKLLELLKEKDIHTYTHSQRVMDLSVLIGFELKFSKQAIEDLAMAAFFHDIGKIAVPDRLLNKPNALTDEEKEVFRFHPRTSAGVLRTAGCSMECVKAVACHHERYDGQGYPYVLQGENIPLSARIISVADAYDSMTSERCYSAAYKKNEAIHRLISCKGTHFDSQITDVFVSRIEKPEVKMLEAV